MGWGATPPTETEREYPARVGLQQKRYAWGDDFASAGKTDDPGY